MDDGTTKGRSTVENIIDGGPLEDPPDSPSSVDEEQSEDSSIPDEPRKDRAEVQNTSPSASHHPKSHKAPAWADPDDATLEVSLASSSRLRKLRDAPEEDAVDGHEYERRLRRQFVKMNPTPEWAAATRRRKRRRAESNADADGDDASTPDLDMLVTSSGGILGRKPRARLEPGVLAIERLRDANQAAQAEGEVTALQFHPSPQVSLLLVASSDRRIRLFNVRFRFLLLVLFLLQSNPHPISHLALTTKIVKTHRSTVTRTRICKPFTSPRCPSPTRSSIPLARPSFSPATVRSITHMICNLEQQRGRRADYGARRLQMATTWTSA